MKLPRALRDLALLRECAGRAEKGASGFPRWTSSRVRTLGIIFSGEYAERASTFKSLAERNETRSARSSMCINRALSQHIEALATTQLINQRPLGTEARQTGRAG